jgi:hypothetical protein
MEWIDDGFAEQTLGKFNVEWTVVGVSIQALEAASKVNSARLHSALDLDHVDNIWTGIKNGDKIPRPVVLSINGKLLVAGGHHRIAAAKKNGEMSIPCYWVVTSDEAAIYGIPAALNSAPDKKPTRQEKVELALRAIERGMKIDEAASAFVISYESLQTEVRIKDFKERCASMGLKLEGIPQTHVRHMIPINNPNVLSPALRIIKGMTTNEVQQFSKSIRAEKTESQQISVVAEMEKRVALANKGAAGKSPAKRAPSTGFRIALATMEKYCDVKTINQLGITDLGEKAEFAKRLEKLAERIKAICERSN